MARNVKKIPPTDAIGVSSSLLATVASAARLPGGAGKLATAVAPVVPDLVAAAQASHEVLVVSLAERDGKVIGRGSEVQDEVDGIPPVDVDAAASPQ